MVRFDCRMRVRSTHPSGQRPVLDSGCRDTIHRIARACGAKNVRLFGSFARGEQRRTSDVDLLVQLPPEFTLLDLAHLKTELEKAIGRKVDVIPDDSIKPSLQERILADARPL